MPILHSLWAAALAVVIINLPFGFWRAGERRFTWPWIVAVHAPVPLVVGVRVVSGLGWQPATFPVFIAAFIIGQFVGGKIRGWWTTPRSHSPRC